MQKNQPLLNFGFQDTASASAFQQSAKLLQHALSSRAITAIETSQNPVLVYSLDRGLKGDAYEIKSSANGLCRITASTPQGGNAATGRWLRGGIIDEAGFHPGEIEESSSPRCEIRGMYFATHYQNYLHVAPEEDIESYLKELALWGCNHFAAWFDMHHYSGMQDPEAVSMIRRLFSNYRAARAASLKTALVIVANEAFSDTAESIRAEWSVQNGYHHSPQAHYHVEVCPNKPGGLKHIIEQRREVFEALRDIPFDQIIIWPYDQGGCTCEICAPWGAKSYPDLARKLSEIAHEYFPEAKIVLSTWSYDRFVDGEWEALDEYFRKNPPDWVDYLMADAMGDDFPEYPLKKGVPGGLPLLNFPEISMEGLVPWGGFGASPMPRRLEKFWSQSGDSLTGGFPYSEGIFEDINKVIMLGLYWGHSVPETVLEYARWEFGGEVAKEISEVIYDLDDNTDHGYWKIDPKGAIELKDIFPSDEKVSIRSFYRIPKLKNSKALYERVEDIETRMKEERRQCWRWRLIRLRAAIDKELEEHEGSFTNQLDQLIEEVIAISHADRADFPLRPLNRRTLIELWNDPAFRPEDWKLLWAERPE